MPAFCAAPRLAEKENRLSYNYEHWKKPEFLRESLWWDVHVVDGDVVGSTLKSAENDELVPEQQAMVYESVPRGGKGNSKLPWQWFGEKACTGYHCDGIDEKTEGQSMAWTQIVYRKKVKVRVKPKKGVGDARSLSEIRHADDCDVLPSRLSSSYKKRIVAGSFLEIEIPFDKDGRRISVECKAEMLEWRLEKQNTHGTEATGNPGYDPKNPPVVGRQPKHALLLFLSPPLPERLDPFHEKSGIKHPKSRIHIMPPGPISAKYLSDLEDDPAKQVVYFPPGLYWMSTNAQNAANKRGEFHLRLGKYHRWVHFALGAFVKSAVEYTTLGEGDEPNRHELLATGFGVLSGSEYVYCANVDKYYTGVKSDWSSLRLWWHRSHENGWMKNAGDGKKRATWTLYGVTAADPPFNSHDMYIEPKISVNDYKQVGAFFYQTDGLYLYDDGVIKNSFLHANDDGLKTYYSQLQFENIQMWKGPNDPVFQLGWYPRNIRNIHATKIDILHTRYNEGNGLPAAIFGASMCYKTDCDWKDDNAVEDFVVQDLICDDVCPALFHVITPLQHYRGIKFEDVLFKKGVGFGDMGVNRVTGITGTNVEVAGGGETHKLIVGGQHKLDFQVELKNVRVLSGTSSGSSKAPFTADGGSKLLLYVGTQGHLTRFEY
eukprot:g4435.t1